MSGPKEIDGGLCNADVALDSDDDARQRAGDVERVECFFDFWCAGLMSVIKL